MKVFMIGGTGLLGSEAARELIKKGHQVKSLALPPLPQGEVLPKEMEIEFGDYIKMSDEELKERIKGCDAFVFAAGVDERVEGAPPIYDIFKKFNIDSLKRVLQIAKKCGVKHSVVCGSYFSYFAKTRKELELTKHHPYIRSRIDQENMCMELAGDDFDIAVLELPYIFGTQPGRKPVWVFLVESIRNMKKNTMWTKGGTTMVTVKQVAQSIVGALEKNKGGKCYPIGYYNMEWKEFLTIVHKYMGYPDSRKIKTIPNLFYKLGGKQLKKKQKKAGLEGGLDMVEFTKLQCSNQFIDKSLGCEILGVDPDNIVSAIGDSIKLSLEVLDGKTKTIDMKGE